MINLAFENIQQPAKQTALIENVEDRHWIQIWPQNCPNF